MRDAEKCILVTATKTDFTCDIAKELAELDGKKSELMEFKSKAEYSGSGKVVQALQFCWFKT